MCILVLGFSNFIWVPMFTTFGRRWVVIVSGLVSLCACIWRANANSYNSMLGASVLHGIGAGELADRRQFFAGFCLCIGTHRTWNG